MLNLKFWIVSLSLASSLIAVSEVVNSAPPQVEHFCYKKTAYGEVVNLAEICPKVQKEITLTNIGTANTGTANTRTPNIKSNPARSTTSDEASADRVRIEGQAKKRKVEFSNYRFDGTTLVGTLRNRTGEPIRNIRIIYEVEVRRGENNWEPVDNGSVSANNRKVEKGGKTSFSASSLEGDRVKITDVEFD